MRRAALVLVGVLVATASVLWSPPPASATAAPDPMLLTNVDLGSGRTPIAVAVTPDGSRVYIANSGNNTVSVMATATNTITATVAGLSSPQGIAITPNGTRAYVTNSAVDTVSVIDTSNNAVTSINDASFDTSHGIAINRTGTRAYVTNSGNNSVSVINTSNNAVTSIFDASFNAPQGVAITPDGLRVYITNSGNNTVSVIDTSNNAVTSITGLNSPQGIAITPDGSRVYVTNTGNNTVSVIRTSDNTIIATVSGVTAPRGAAAGVDGSSIYVSNFDGDVTRISTATNVVALVYPANASGLIGITVGPGGGRIYATGSTTNSLAILETGARVACTYAYSWPSGGGTTANPYRVASQSDLNAIRYCPSSAFILTQDIALSGSWTPIGTRAVSFTGDFDGDGHTITGLMIGDASAPAGEPVGLFGMAQGATMRDLTIFGGQASVTRDEVGLLVGNCEECAVAAVEVTGSVSALGDNVGGLAGILQGTTSTLANSSSAAMVQGNSLTGGLAGSVYSATVTDTCASGAVTGTTKVGGLAGAASDFALLDRTCASGAVTGSQQVGGLVGVLGPPNSPAPGNAATISRSFASGNVTATDPSVAVVGGLVGALWNSNLDEPIANSFATGSVAGAGIVGGLVGSAVGNDALTETSYAVGALSGPPGNSTGGVFGEVGSTAATNYNALYWNIEATGRTFGVGGLGPVTTGLNISNVTGLTSEQMRYSTNFAGWDFTSVWGYDCQESTYPLLRWAYPTATATSCPTGGAAPAPTPTVAAAQPSVSPTTEPAAEVPVTRQPPGSARATINGVQVPVTATTLGRGQGMRIAFGPVTFTLRSTTPAGQPVPLSPQGALIIARAGELPATGGGLAPASQVDMTLYSSPVQLGTAQVMTSGSILSAPTIPSTTPLGSHTLVLTGVTDTGADFALELGVRVARPVAALGAAPVVTVHPRPAQPGDHLSIRAVGVQSRCSVEFSLGSSSARTRASTDGHARATLVAPARGHVLKIHVRGKGCGEVRHAQRV